MLTFASNCPDLTPTKEKQTQKIYPPPGLDMDPHIQKQACQPMSYAAFPHWNSLKKERKKERKIERKKAEKQSKVKI